MAKSMAENAMFNMAYKALSVLFPLVAISYASRKLGASGIGDVSSAQNLVTYFTMFAALGIPSYGVRAIAQSKKNKNECNRTFTELFVINVISTCVCVLAYFVLIQTIGNYTYSITLNKVFATLIILNVFNLEWVYQGFEEYKYIALRSFLVKGISLFFLILFVRDSSDAAVYAGIICFGTVGNYFLNLTKLHKYVKFDLKNLNCSRHFQTIMTFFGSVIAIELYSLLDITMLTYMTDSENVGYYSNATKIIKTVANTMTAIGAVLLPRLSIYFKEKDYQSIERVVKKFFNAIMLLAIPSCVGIQLISDEIVLVMFGEKFIPASVTIKILSPLIILMPLSGGIFGQILLTSGREKVYLKSVCIGAASNMLLNAICINLWKQDGAAFASVITETLVSGSMILSCKDIPGVKVKIKDYYSVICSVLIMALWLIIVDRYFVSTTDMVTLIVKIIVGVACYGVGLLVFKNEMAMQVLGKLVREQKRNSE